MSPYKFTCKVTSFVFFIFFSKFVKKHARGTAPVHTPVPKILDFSGHFSYECFSGEFLIKHID